MGDSSFSVGVINVLMTCLPFKYGSRWQLTAQVFIVVLFFKATYPLLGCLVAKVQCSGVPVHSDVGITNRGPVICTLYGAAPTEPAEKTNS